MFVIFILYSKITRIVPGSEMKVTVMKIPS